MLRYRLSGVGLLLVAAALFTPAAPPEPIPTKVALVVGVNRYEKRGFADEPLPYAERDANELATELKAAGFRVVLLGPETRATRSAIEQGLEELLRGRNASDIVLIALAGHGLQTEVKDATGRKRLEAFFAPCDGIKDDLATLLSVGDLLGKLKSRGGRNLLLIDACRNDPSQDRGGIDGDTVESLPLDTAVLFSCSRGQRAWESAKAGGGHGIFFHFVLEGLRGRAADEDGEVNWDRLADYVKRRVTPRLVKEWVPQAPGDDPQTPHGLSNFRGRSPVLVRRGRSWTMLGGSPSRNRVNLEERNLPTDWCVKPGEMRNVKWHVPIHGFGWGEVTVHRGKVFVNALHRLAGDGEDMRAEDALFCFSEENGRLLWRVTHPHGKDFDRSWEVAGICSTPCVEGERVYYLTGDNELICADTEGHADGEDDGAADAPARSETEGDIVWRVKLNEVFGTFHDLVATGSPLVIGDRVYVSTGGGFSDKKESAPPVVALNRETGKGVWRFQLPEGDETPPGFSSLSMAVVEGQTQLIYAAKNGRLYGLRAETGELLWRFDGLQSSKEKEGAREYIASPVAVFGKVFIGQGGTPWRPERGRHGNGESALSCIRLGGSGDLSPLLADSTDPEKTPTKPNPNSGLVWKYDGSGNGEERGGTALRTMITTCVIHDGLLYAADLDGRLHCLDVDSGKALWVHDTRSAFWGSPFLADGKVYVGNTNGDLYVFAHGREERLINTIPMKAPISSTPVAVNGVLYVRTAKYLYAIGGQP